MRTFVLVHGAASTEWVWERVAELLRSRGFKVITPSLPGHDVESFDIRAMTLQNYVEAISECVQRESEPVVLVGHSMGGLVITQVAENLPNHVSHLVYVTAILLTNGQCGLDMMAAQQELPNIDPPAYASSADGTCLTVNCEVSGDIVFGCCDDATIQKANNNWCPQSWAPFQARLALTDEKFGSVPKTYIMCLRDRVIQPEMQRRMVAGHKGVHVMELDTDHCPSLSEPQALADMLCGI